LDLDLEIRAVGQQFGLQPAMEILAQPKGQRLRFFSFGGLCPGHSFILTY
jgi:hypothetical protein